MAHCYLNLGEFERARATLDIVDIEGRDRNWLQMMAAICLEAGETAKWRSFSAAAVAFQQAPDLWSTPIDSQFQALMEMAHYFPISERRIAELCKQWVESGGNEGYIAAALRIFVRRKRLDIAVLSAVMMPITSERPMLQATLKLLQRDLVAAKNGFSSLVIADSYADLERLVMLLECLPMGQGPTQDFFDSNLTRLSACSEALSNNQEQDRAIAILKLMQQCARVFGRAEQLDQLVGICKALEGRTLSKALVSFEDAVMFNEAVPPEFKRLLLATRARK
jgi:hypothetical protein